ncbi:hypothetical protein EFN18_00850 [Propionibacterium freudenreichii]|nr:hypothetical protein [Propionibacterium freudenreichii]
MSRYGAGIMRPHLRTITHQVPYAARLMISAGPASTATTTTPMRASNAQPAVFAAPSSRKIARYRSGLVVTSANPASPAPAS